LVVAGSEHVPVHALQLAAAAALYVPGAHNAHAVTAEAAYVPAAQLWQVLLDV